MLGVNKRFFFYISFSDLIIHFLILDGRNYFFLVTQLSYYDLIICLFDKIHTMNNDIFHLFMPTQTDNLF